MKALTLSKRARRIEVSPTIAMSARATALKASGRDVLDFSVGEPDQPTPRHVARAGIQAIEAGRTRYTASAGLPELRAAIAHRYREDYGAGFAPEQVMAAVGGKHALYCVCQALLDPGDEVVIPAPYWPTFSEAVRLAGGKPVVVETREEEGFRVSARRVARALTPRTRAIVVNSPNNPTGAVIDAEELLALGALARRRGAMLLYDDTYAQLSYVEARAGLLGELGATAGDFLTVLGTASKSYCMTGWRIGWVLGPRGLVDACAALASHSTQNPATFAQLGAVAALTGPQDEVAARRAEYRRRLEFLFGALSAVPGLTCFRPQGAFYAFPNVKGFLSRALPTSLALALTLLEEQGVAVVPGEAFAFPGYVRISFARSLEALQEGARRIAAFLEGLPR